MGVCRIFVPTPSVDAPPESYLRMFLIFQSLALNGCRGKIFTGTPPLYLYKLQDLYHLKDEHYTKRNLTVLTVTISAAISSSYKLSLPGIRTFSRSFVLIEDAAESKPSCSCSWRCPATSLAYAVVLIRHCFFPYMFARHLWQYELWAIFV